jgi:hypothetical protein
MMLYHFVGVTDMVCLFLHNKKIKPHLERQGDFTYETPNLLTASNFKSKSIALNNLLATDSLGCAPLSILLTATKLIPAFSPNCF